MKLLVLRTTKTSATHTKDGAFFRILDTETTTIFTNTPPTEAESVAALAESLGLESYTYVAPAPPAPKVPSVIANWRAQAVLSIAGILPAVDAALDSLPEPSRTIALAAWNGGAEVHRNGPTVAAAIAALGLSDAEVDAMFLQAASLQV